MPTHSFMCLIHAPAHTLVHAIYYLWEAFYNDPPLGGVVKFTPGSDSVVDGCTIDGWAHGRDETDAGHWLLARLWCVQPRPTRPRTCPQPQTRHQVAPRLPEVSRGLWPRHLRRPTPRVQVACVASCPHTGHAPWSAGF